MEYRDFEPEDVEHLDDAIRLLKDKLNATSLPGLEAVREQVAVRVDQIRMSPDG